MIAGRTLEAARPKANATTCGHEAGRIDPEHSGDHHRHTRRDPGGDQLTLDR